MDKFGFPKAWLLQKKRKIYINDKQILTCNDLTYQQYQEYFQPLQTRIEKGVILIEKEATPRYISVDELNQLGFSLRFYNPSGTTKKYLKFMMGTSQYSVDESQMGTNRILYKSVSKLARIVGPNSSPTGTTEWFKLDATRKRRPTYDPDKLINPIYLEEQYNRLIDRFKGNEIVEKYVKIDDMPIMKTLDNKIVCIPVDIKDAPTIGIVGSRGTGKSTMLNSIIGSIFYRRLNDLHAFLNDSQDQFYDLHLSNDNKKWVRELSNFNLFPRPLPAVNIYMSAPEIMMRYEKEGIDFRYVVNFFDFLSRYSFFTHSVKDWDIKGTERYLAPNEVRKRLCQCYNEEDVKNALDELFPMVKGKDTLKDMKKKWVDTFTSIFQGQFTDNLFIDNPLVSSRWELENDNGTRIENNPIIISAEAGLLPVINTRFVVKRQKYFRNGMADILQSIADWQKRTDKSKMFWIYIDELKDLYPDTGKSPDNCKNKLETELFQQGRFNRIGCVYNLQDYLDISKGMRKNTNYLLVGLLNSGEERRAICSDHTHISKEMMRDMGRLRKHEFIASTTETFIVYDNEGNREVVEGGAFRGYGIPPLAKHLSPIEAKIIV